MHKKHCGCTMTAMPHQTPTPMPMPMPTPAHTCGCQPPMPPTCCKCKPAPMPMGCGCVPAPKPICKVVEKFEYQEVPHVQPIHTHVVTNKVNVHKTYPKYTCSHETKCHDKFC